MKKLILLFLLLPSIAFGQYIVWIDDGDTGGAGTELDPFGAFSEINWTTAENEAGDNSTIYLVDGSTWTDTLTVGGSGSSGFPITVKRTGGGTMPIINAATVGVDFSAENFIVIDGIHITNGTNNFLLSAGSDNNAVINCVSEDAGARGVSLSSSDDVVISGNTFTSSGDISLNISTTVNLILENNIIENCIGNCIVLSGSTNGIIKNNYIDGSTEEQLYVRGTTTGNIFSGNIFANTSDAYTVRLRDSGIVGNMFYGNVWYLGGIGIATTSPVGSGTIFKNNIMYKTTTSDFLLFPSGSTANVEIENNLYFSTAASETTNMFTWDGTTTIGFDDWQALGNDNGTGTFGYYSDPLFDNATAGDFWTDNESSDIFENGQGITNYNDRIEFDSIFGAGGSVTTTTQADTIGAFEFVSAGGGSGVHLGPITLENILLENLCIGNCP